MRALIYDTLIVRLTAGWYRAVLERLPQGCRLLDVGIGTGSALIANAAQLVRKQMHVTGIDIDADYVERCRRAVAQQRLTDHIEARLESVYDHRGGPYGAVYFSASFMLLPDPPAALRHVTTLLAPEGRIYFTQTFELKRSPGMEVLKPLLRRFTTIDFGRVNYEADFRQALADGGLEVQELTTLSRSGPRAAILAVATPDAG